MHTNDLPDSAKRELLRLVGTPRSTQKRERHPAMPDATTLDEWLHGAERLRARGDLRDAAFVFRTVAELCPLDARAFLGLGRCALEAGDPQRALAAFEAAAALFGGELGAHAGRALAYADLDEWSACTRATREALLADPDGSSALTRQLARRWTERLDRRAPQADTRGVDTVPARRG